jgi:hypothetical protein
MFELINIIRTEKQKIQNKKKLKKTKKKKKIKMLKTKSSFLKSKKQNSTS